MQSERENKYSIPIAVVAALSLIVLSLARFMLQVDKYINMDMRGQMQAIQTSSTRLIQNELISLKQQTASAAMLMQRAQLEDDEEIVQILRDFADSADLAWSTFVTLDGHTYTNYAGDLGRHESHTFLDGVPIQEIRETVFWAPYYVDALQTVVVGVACPATLGGEQGVLMSAFDVRRIRTLLDHAFMGSAVEIGVLSSQGRVVLGKDMREFGLDVFALLQTVQFSTASAEQMRSDFTGGKAGFSAYYVGGMERYCAYGPVEDTDLYVLAMVKKVALRQNLMLLEKYGAQLAVELIAIMGMLLLVIIAVRHREQKRVQRILQKAATLDGLTGIYNRRTAETEIVELLTRDIQGAGMLVIDIDDFKRINDQWGHIAGDHVLRELALRLKRVFTEDDVIGRMGGDEFVVLVQSCKNQAQLEVRLERLITDFYVAVTQSEQQKISLSIGVAFVERDDTFLSLYQKADTALYRAKKDGKGRFRL